MRRWILVLFVVATLAGISARAEGYPSSAVSLGVVASVYDGDTLTLTSGKRVRLVQIDAPELGSGECYSRAARTALVQQVPIGSRVVLEVDPKLDKIDRYGRLLRYVKRGTMNVNVALVRAGAAAPYFYQRERGKYAARLMVEATRAKASKRGLWKACPRAALDPYGPVETGKSGPPSDNGDGGGGGGARCDPSYTGACIPSPPPDLDCADIEAMGLAPVRVVGSDPHGLDGDNDGWGCE